MIQDNKLIIVISIILMIVIIYYNWDSILNPYHNYQKVESVAELLNCSGKCYYTNK